MKSIVGLLVVLSTACFASPSSAIFRPGSEAREASPSSPRNSDEDLSPREKCLAMLAKRGITASDSEPVDRTQVILLERGDYLQVLQASRSELFVAAYHKESDAKVVQGSFFQMSLDGTFGSDTYLYDSETITDYLLEKVEHPSYLVVAETTVDDVYRFEIFLHRGRSDGTYLVTHYRREDRGPVETRVYATSTTPPCRQLRERKGSERGNAIAQLKRLGEPFDFTHTDILSTFRRHRYEHPELTRMPDVVEFYSRMFALTLLDHRAEVIQRIVEHQHEHRSWFPLEEALEILDGIEDPDRTPLEVSGPVRTLAAAFKHLENTAFAQQAEDMRTELKRELRRAALIRGD